MHQVTFTQTNAQRVWHKRYEDERSSLLRLLQCTAASALSLEWLRPTCVGSAAQLAATEKRFIQRLQSRSVRAPQIVSESENSLTLGDLGPTLSALCKNESDPARRLHYIKNALQAISEVHQKDLCLNQSFARNICIENGEVGFIDFECDPLEVMSLSVAQARDIIYFVYSTARFVEDDADVYQSFLEKIINDESLEVKKVLESAFIKLKKIAWLVSLLDKKFSAFWRVYSPRYDRSSIKYSNSTFSSKAGNKTEALSFFKMVTTESFAEIVAGIGASGAIIATMANSVGVV
jgi:tRNA A-37 threonylcarbamoyl transferase component Bud32